MADAPRTDGGDWTAAEIDAAVRAYRDMLAKEIAGQPYNKTEHRRALMAGVARSEGSIEFKHQNISAVLEEVGQPWIRGYKPRHNFQASLVDAVERIILPMLDASKPVLPAPESAVAKDVFVDPPVPRGEENASPAVRRLARKIDQAERDRKNRELGRLGEEFVVDMEKKKLAHKPDLAAAVSWVSQTKGDGLGYDIASFDEAGGNLFIEVKTTRGGIATPFYISASELAAAAEIGSAYRLYRVFDFGPSSRIYRLSDPLDEALELIPSTFRAKPR